MKATTLSRGSEVEKLAEAFFDAARKYWAAYQEAIKRGDAVVWLEDTERGGLVVFTRGEHSRDLKSFIDELNCLGKPVEGGGE